MMERREFLFMMAAQGWGLFSPTKPAHLLDGLTDISTGRDYVRDPKKFSLILFITAQRSYLSCDSALLSVRQVMRTMTAEKVIDPVVVMPKISDQASSSDRRNLNLALQMALPFTILSGDLAKMQSAAQKVGAYFETNSEGKVTGHSQKMFFIAPNGKKLAEHDAEEVFNFIPLAQRLIMGCASKRDLCFE